MDARTPAHTPNKILITMPRLPASRLDKNVGGSMILNLCTSSDDVLYLYQVSRKYLKGFQSY